MHTMLYGLNNKSAIEHLPVGFTWLMAAHNSEKSNHNPFSPSFHPALFSFSSETQLIGVPSEPHSVAVEPLWPQTDIPKWLFPSEEMD